MPDGSAGRRAEETLYRERRFQGHIVFPGYLPGAEDGQGGWGLWITGPRPRKV